MIKIEIKKDLNRVIQLLNSIKLLFFSMKIKFILINQRKKKNTPAEPWQSFAKERLALPETDQDPGQCFECRFRVLVKDILLRWANHTMTQYHLQLHGQLGCDGEPNRGSSLIGAGLSWSKSSQRKTVKANNSAIDKPTHSQPCSILKREWYQGGPSHWYWCWDGPIVVWQFQHGHIWKRGEERWSGTGPRLPNWHWSRDCPSTETELLQHGPHSQLGIIAFQQTTLTLRSSREKVRKWEKKEKMISLDLGREQCPHQALWTCLSRNCGKLLARLSWFNHWAKGFSFVILFDNFSSLIFGGFKEKQRDPFLKHEACKKERSALILLWFVHFNSLVYHKNFTTWKFPLLARHVENESFIFNIHLNLWMLQQDLHNLNMSKATGTRKEGRRLLCQVQSSFWIEG